MYNKIYKSVIKPIEITDTTGTQNPLSTFFRFKNASETPIEAFNKTVEEMRLFFNGVKEECLKIAPELERAKQFYDEETDGAVYSLPVDEPFIQTDIISQLSDKILYYVHKSDRAPDNYNLKLSQRRAESAMEYIINNGIGGDETLLSDSNSIMIGSLLGKKLIYNNFYIVYMYIKTIFL